MGDRRLRAHANRCSKCRELLEAQTALAKLAPLMPRARPRLNFAERVVRVAVAEGIAARRRRFGTALAVAAAAAVLVAALPLARFFNSPSEPMHDAVAQPSTPAPASEIAPSRPIAVRQSPEPYVRFAHGVGETVASSIVYVPGLGPGPEHLDETLPEPISSGLRPFRPLRSSMAAAVDAIRQALPLSPDAGSTSS
jgi:hypothetical protein